MSSPFDALAAMGERLRLWVETHAQSEPMAEGEFLIP